METPDDDRALRFSATEARRLIGSKGLSPVELVKSCLKRIADVDGALHAITAIDEERALAESPRRRGRGNGGRRAIAGAAWAAGRHQGPRGDRRAAHHPRIAASMTDDVPAADDPVVANIRAAGGIILCKTNTPEFGAGANTTNRVFGATGNPFDPSKTCAGSSGGSAVALATGMVAAGVGLRPRRQPANARGLLRRRRLPSVAWSGCRSVVDHRPQSDGRAGADGPDRRRHPPAAARHARLRPWRPVLARSTPSTPATPLPQPTSRRCGWRSRWTYGIATVSMEVRATVRRPGQAVRARCSARPNDRDPPFADVHEAFGTLRALSYHAAYDELLDRNAHRLGPNVIANTELGRQLTVAEISRAHSGSRPASTAIPSASSAKSTS